MPYALAIGISYNDFWTMNPHIISIHADAYKIKRKLVDEEMWSLGLYIMNAVSVAVERNLAGKKAKSKYLEKPLMHDLEVENNLTQEEIDKREIEKMILAEEQWIAASRQKGLPKTKLKKGQTS